MKHLLSICAAAALSLSAPTDGKAEEIDRSKLADGWLMHFYPIQDNSKPDSPSGRSLATLLYTGSFPVGYDDAFELEPELKKYRDRLWLVEYDGYLNLTEAGPYTFALTFEWEGAAVCGAKLELEGKQLVELPITKRGERGPRNAYVDVQLKAGLYRAKTKAYCTATGGYNPQFELAIRGPSDPKPIPVNSSIMKHLRP
jgi:hypothetical protein